MTAQHLAVIRTGLVTSVGLSAAASCAAIRSKLTNPSETRFVEGNGEWIMGHGVPLDVPLTGLSRLARMAALAAHECAGALRREELEQVPLLLCVSEKTRPGRLQGLDEHLLMQICTEMGNASFAPESGVVPHGRVAAAVALLRARQMLYGPAPPPAVLIVGVDSLLMGHTLQCYESQVRLLTAANPNGFIPGEAASAMLVTRSAASSHLRIEGLGFGVEAARIDSEEPLRADGLALAIARSLSDAGCALHDLDFRIADLSGEQYYFKEAALALLRTLRQRKEEFDIWHPAESIGEVGSAIGPAMLAVAEFACRKGFAPGPGVLLHAANDAGERAAVVTRYVSSI